MNLTENICIRLEIKVVIPNKHYALEKTEIPTKEKTKNKNISKLDDHKRSARPG